MTSLAVSAFCSVDVAIAAPRTMSSLPGALGPLAVRALVEPRGPHRSVGGPALLWPPLSLTMSASG